MDWTAGRERLNAPMFAPLRPAIERLPRDGWPTHADLTAAARGTATSRGMPVRFVLPREHTDRERRYYELRIAETGEIETRVENWHDLFNALAWITYPRAKAAINAQHAAILGERGDVEARNRGPERDSLTLFDEGGVAVVSTDPALFRLIVDFQWKALFWNRREELARQMLFLGFGHALFEQAMAPYLGMVAKTVFIPVEEIPTGEGLAGFVDRALAGHFADRSRFATPKLMAPMPVLGVPGWHPGTGDESFYDDHDHFRSKGASQR